jgi:RNA polymerase sigma-B factor
VPAELQLPPRPVTDLEERVLADRRLFLRLHDPRDPVDRDAVVERFLPIARRLAARYQRANEPFDDVFQVACIGLVKAIERYDPDRGIAFSSYAVPTISGEIKRYFRDHTWAVRVPRDTKDLAVRVDAVVRDLTRERGRAPSVEDVAVALDSTLEDVLEAMQAATAARTTSLDEPRASGDEEAGETRGEATGADDYGFDRAEERALLDSLMASLSPREREVLRLRFHEDLTQAEIGERIGISQMQISRVLRQALGRLHILAGAR